MSQGNTIALKRTLDSFKGIVDEIIYGDLLIFEDDRKVIEKYKKKYNLKTIKFPFNYIFENGFSSLLNNLAEYATNDLVLYMNCSEIVDGEERILRLINELFHGYNCFAFDHETDKHSWFRLYNRKELKWQGLIHEEIVGERRDCPYYIFRMKDTEKDMGNAFKAKVYNDIKELTYFNQYIKLVEHPELQGITNDWWVSFAKENYESMKDRLQKKGKRYEAFLEGNLQKFIDDINSNPEFKNEKHVSSTLVNFQGARKDIL